MFDEPVRAHVDFGDGPEPALLWGWIPGATKPDGTRGDGKGLCCRGDGTMEEISKDFITVDWRYEPQSDKWLDLAHGASGEDEPEA